VNESESRYLWFGALQSGKDIVEMGQIVKCDICGKIYNESHLTTHKRRSHSKQGTPRSAESATASVEGVLFLYEGLSEDQKREVLNRLSQREQIKP
jgi:hypothetical protein